MIRDLAAWLAADPTNPVLLVGVALILGMLCYGVVEEFRR